MEAAWIQHLFMKFDQVSQQEADQVKTRYEWLKSDSDVKDWMKQKLKDALDQVYDSCPDLSDIC
jgi:hypothetical protein